MSAKDESAPIRATTDKKPSKISIYDSINYYLKLVPENN